VTYNSDKTTTSTENERPDTDGVITNDEALDWYHFAGGAALSIDESLIRFDTSSLSVEDFINRNTNILSVNFFNKLDIHFFDSIIYKPASSEPLSHVFGTIRLELVNELTGEVKIVPRSEGAIDRYDFSTAREVVANAQRDNGSPKGYLIYGKGNTGTINLVNPNGNQNRQRQNRQKLRN
jgi:hypothetical protein